MLSENFIISFELLKEKIEDENIYPYNLPIVQNIEKLMLHKNVTFIIGENGTGKSTLLEAVATQYWLNPEWWSQNISFSTETTHSSLSEIIRIAKGFRKAKDSYFLRAESFYNVASEIDELDRQPCPWPKIIDSYGWVSLHEQSHWESFFSLFLNRFWWNWIYILDEPEAALSPQRQIAFLVQLNELVKQNSQFIIATHSPILLSYPNAKIIEISKTWCEERDYKDTEHYRSYTDYLNNTEYMLDKLGIKKLTEES